MANPTWPASLPQNLLSRGFQEQAQDQTVRSNMDAGPPKVRRRFTAKVVSVRGSVEIDSTQYTTLQTFFDTTLAGGTLPFDWTHPITGDSTTYRFTKPIQYSAAGPVLFTAAMELEVLP